MKWILDEISSRQRLIERKHNRIVLRVSLVTALHGPVIRRSLLGSKASDVIGKHMQVGSVVQNPACKLLSATRSQHHARRVVAATVEKSREVWIGSLSKSDARKLFQTESEIRYFHFYLPLMAYDRV